MDSPLDIWVADACRRLERDGLGAANFGALLAAPPPASVNANEIRAALRGAATAVYREHFARVASDAHAASGAILLRHVDSADYAQPDIQPRLALKLSRLFTGMTATKYHRMEALAAAAMAAKLRDAVARPC